MASDGDVWGGLRANDKERMEDTLHCFGVSGTIL
jgi:hypothetical protein